MHEHTASRCNTDDIACFKPYNTLKQQQTMSTENSWVWLFSCCHNMKDLKSIQSIISTRILFPLLAFYHYIGHCSWTIFWKCIVINHYKTSFSNSSICPLYNAFIIMPLCINLKLLFWWIHWKKERKLKLKAWNFQVAMIIWALYWQW